MSFLASAPFVSYAPVHLLTNSHSHFLVTCECNCPEMFLLGKAAITGMANEALENMPEDEKCSAGRFMVQKDRLSVPTWISIDAAAREQAILCQKLVELPSEVSC